MLLAAIGDLVLDITIAPHGELRTNDDTPAAIRVGGGGQAANFCAWAASLGERSRLVTRVGDDDAGRRLEAELEAGGVEVHAVRAAEPTGAIAVLIGPGGERTMATQRGASVGLRRDDLRPEWFVGVDLIHVPAYSLFREPLATAARTAVEMVRLGRGRVSVDLSSVAGLVDYGPARLGAAGCIVCGRRIASPAADVVDPTGAGDAFAAAFCIAIVSGEGPQRAGEHAVRVAAAAVAKVGARPA
ncbi:MAG: hypothetical protein E6I77_00355 [Chloroflexi bacterium]|nr:MAG: hypothetical protein E6I77_00355 [Chloroflexota bacterium]